MILPTEKPKAGTSIFVDRGRGQMIELRSSGGGLVLLSLAACVEAVLYVSCMGGAVEYALRVTKI